MNQHITRDSNEKHGADKSIPDDFSSEPPAGIWTMILIFIVLALSLAFPVILFLSNAP